MSIQYRIKWTKVDGDTSRGFLDGNIWENINKAYHHLNKLIAAYEWDGYVIEEPEQ